jgi:hypothetical protein
MARVRAALRPPDLGLIFGWSWWRRAHQAIAMICHWKRRGHGKPLHFIPEMRL